MVLLAALEQFKDQATDRLLLLTLKKYEDSSTREKEDVRKTAAEMLAQLYVNIHCM